MSPDQLLSEAEKVIINIEDPAKRAEMLLRVYDCRTRDMEAGRAGKTNDISMSDIPDGDVPFVTGDYMTDQKAYAAIKDIARVINRNNLEAGSNTPDHILADFVFDMLTLLNKTITHRDIYHRASHIEAQEKTPDVAEAVKIVCDALYKDSAMWQSWQANITMAFCDTWSQHRGKEDPKKIAELAAKSFLNSLVG